MDEPRRPVVIEFENATPTEEEHSVTFKTDPQTKETELTVEYGGKLNTEYRGTVGASYPTDLMNSYLAFRNKTTNEVRFVKVDRCRLKSSHHYRQEHAPETMAIDARSILLKNFGSKAAARAMDRHEKTAYNSDIIRNKMDESLSVFNDSAVVKTDESSDDIRPPYNKEATNVKDAYRLADMWPLEVLHALEAPALGLIECKTTKLPFTTPFIVNTIKTIQVSEQPDSKVNLAKLKICIYMDCLISLLNSKSKIIGNNEIPEIAKPIAQHIRETFSEKSSAKL